MYYLALAAVAAVAIALLLGAGYVGLVFGGIAERERAGH
jgi:hypothetical protein